MVFGQTRARGEIDLELGTRRARAAALLLLALPGSVYLYQGEELGLPEVLDLPDEARRDPIWFRSAGREHGRDGSRVPLPWAPSGPTFGFSPPDVDRTWLPQPDWYAEFAAARQDGVRVRTTGVVGRHRVAQPRRSADGDQW